MENRGKKALAIILILAAIGGPSSVYAYNSYNYSKFFNEGQTNIEKEEYNNAIDTFNFALKYKKKNSEEIAEQIKLAEDLKNSKTIYEDALKKLNEKKYLEAISIFEKIKKEDIKRYELSQSKIVESKKLYIEENIKKAQNEATSKKYTDGIKYLDLVIKVDPKNELALKLKEEFSKAIKTEEEARLKAEKAQQLQEQSKVSGTEVNKASQPNSTNNGNAKITMINNGFNVYKSDGTWSSYQSKMIIDEQYRQLVFKVFKMGTTYTPDCDYKIVFHLEEGDVVYNGRTSSELKFIPISTYNFDKNILADIYVNYKGETIKFTGTLMDKDSRR